MIAMKDAVGNENKTQKALAFSLSGSTLPHPSVKSAPSTQSGKKEESSTRALLSPEKTVCVLCTDLFLSEVRSERERVQKYRAGAGVLELAI